MPTQENDPSGERFEAYFQFLQLVLFGGGSNHEVLPEDDAAFGIAMLKAMREREAELSELRRRARVLDIPWQAVSELL